MTNCSSIKTRKKPIAAVHSATGYSVSKIYFISSLTSGIMWRRQVAKKMPAAKQFKYAISSEDFFPFVEPFLFGNNKNEKTIIKYAEYTILIKWLNFTNYTSNVSQRFFFQERIVKLEPYIIVLN